MSGILEQLVGIAILSGFLMLFIGILIGALIMVSSKSKRYRKHLTNMYVSSRIRELAKEDKLDINKEEIDFKSWCKNDKIERNGMNLDNSVEEELIEKVNKRKETK